MRPVIIAFILSGLFTGVGCTTASVQNPGKLPRENGNEGIFSKTARPLSSEDNLPELKRWRAAWEAYSGGRVMGRVVREGDWFGAQYSLRTAPDDGAGHELLSLGYEGEGPEDGRPLIVSSHAPSPFVPERNVLRPIEPGRADAEDRPAPIPWREALNRQASELERRTKLFREREAALRRTPIKLPPGEDATLDRAITSLMERLPESIRPTVAFEMDSPKNCRVAMPASEGRSMPLEKALALLLPARRFEWRLERGVLFIGESRALRSARALLAAEKTAAGLALKKLRRELATVTRAEICILRRRTLAEDRQAQSSGEKARVPGFPLHPYGSEEPIVRTIRLQDEKARMLATLAGSAADTQKTGAFSHENPVGLRFRQGDRLIWETSISFESRNIQLAHPWPDDRLGGAPSTRWRWVGLGAEASELKSRIDRIVAEAENAFPENPAERRTTVSGNAGSAPGSHP